MTLATYSTQHPTPTASDKCVESLDIWKIEVQCLNRCKNLKKLPTRASKLTKLEFLDICGTSIPSLPEEIKYMVHLRCLRAAFSSRGKEGKDLHDEVMIPLKIIQNLKKLEELSINAGLYSPSSETAEQLAMELASLEYLTTLHFNFPNVKAFNTFVTRCWSRREEGEYGGGGRRDVGGLHGGVLLLPLQVGQPLRASGVQGSGRAVPEGAEEEAPLPTDEERGAPPRRCGCDEEFFELHPVASHVSMVSALESLLEDREVIELEKEMWDKFYGTGFWRSPSQRRRMDLDSNPDKINPLVPLDLVIDHSVQVDVARSENDVQANMDLEFKRNKERFLNQMYGGFLFVW
ncbi:hypothetical protein ACS0TY_012790 [Phlomoides rotata]